MESAVFIVGHESSVRQMGSLQLSLAGIYEELSDE
jgi:hypothetical protein